MGRRARAEWIRSGGTIQAFHCFATRVDCPQTTGMESPKTATEADDSCNAFA
jgi:hypothetical protein